MGTLSSGASKIEVVGCLLIVSRLWHQTWVAPILMFAMALGRVGLLVAQLWGRRSFSLCICNWLSATLRYSFYLHRLSNHLWWWSWSNSRLFRQNLEGFIAENWWYKLVQMQSSVFWPSSWSLIHPIQHEISLCRHWSEADNCTLSLYFLRCLCKSRGLQ